MGKRSLFNVAGLALLTVFALPQTSMAGTDKSLDKNVTTDVSASKKAQLLKAPASEEKSGAAGPSGAKGESGASGTQPLEIRNWAAIDTNKNHSIEAEEMEKFLNDHWATQKKAAAKAK